MNYILAALAVYKVIQILDALTPKEAMPWVKIGFSIILGYASMLVIDIENYLIGGLVVSALAGVSHAVIRLLILLGDMAQKKSMR
jgi:hypothetical protein